MGVGGRCCLEVLTSSSFMGYSILLPLCILHKVRVCGERTRVLKLFKAIHWAELRHEIDVCVYTLWTLLPFDLVSGDSYLIWIIELLDNDGRANVSHLTMSIGAGVRF